MGENTSINVILKTKASKITVLRFCCFGLKLLKVFIAVEKNLIFFSTIYYSVNSPFPYLSFRYPFDRDINQDINQYVGRYLL